MDTLYQEEILEHYKHPHNHGALEDADIVQVERNASCGDELTFYVKLDAHTSPDATSENGARTTIKKITFYGNGCAISQAAASMLTDEIQDMSTADAAALTPEFVTDLLGIDLGPTRLKCALLSLQGIKRALAQNQESTTVKI